MCPVRRQSLDELFEEVTPEDLAWAQLGAVSATQPQAQVAVQQPFTSSTQAVAQPSHTGAASLQIHRVKAGQQLLPVYDHGYDHDHNHNHDQNKADDDKQTVDLECVPRGKGTLKQQTGDTWHDNSSNDPWQIEKHRMEQ